MIRISAFIVVCCAAAGFPARSESGQAFTAIAHEYLSLNGVRKHVGTYKVPPSGITKRIARHMGMETIPDSMIESMKREDAVYNRLRHR